MIHNRHGFTLVEILAAIFIFSLLITTLFGSFRVLTTSSSALGEGTLQFEMVQGCLARIVTDIESIFVSHPPSYKQPETGEAPDPYRVEGDASYAGGNSFARLRFTSLSHVPTGRTQQLYGVAEIVYYVTRLDTGEFVLRRSDRLYPYGEFEEKDTDPVVCRNVQGFDVTYYDGEGKDTENWDSESSEFNFSTPRAMGILLKIGDEDAPDLFATRVYISTYREKKV